jgi:hypothetical protein
MRSRGKKCAKAWNISRYFSDHEFVYQYEDGKEVTYQLRKVCLDFKIKLACMICDCCVFLENERLRRH